MFFSFACVYYTLISVNGKCFRWFLEKNMAKTYYEILGVSQNADFSELKSAYYRCAKLCHPDRFGNSEAKKEEFQELVHAFDVLSDVARRHEYDLSLGVADAAAGARATSAGPAIMDRESDEVLEELVVGNDLPLGSTLATLLTDLAGTELFLLYREGKDHYMHRRFIQAEYCFSQAVRKSPNNIVFRARYARALCERGKYTAAMKQYRIALDIGRHRKPPLLLRRLTREFEVSMRRHLPVRFWFRQLFVKPQHGPIPDASEEMVNALNRAFARSLAESKPLTLEEREVRHLENKEP